MGVRIYPTDDDKPLPARCLSVREWRELKDAFDNRCAYCGTQRMTLIIEHVEPLSRGGADSRANVVPSCRGCNSSKADMLLLEWIMAEHGPCMRMAMQLRYPKFGEHRGYIRLRPEFRDD